MYQLREYQERTLTELYSWLKRHPDGNPVVDACVGAGKSVVIAEFCKRAIEQYPQTRIVMCVASKELCQQNLEKLLAIWEDAPAGVCSASLGEKDLESQIIFATIGSIARSAHELGVVDLLIIDECHNVNPDNAGMYREFINDLKQFGSKHLCTIGFTGTPFRGDGVWLWQGKDPLFKGTATRVSMDELLDQGYLAPLVVDKSTPATIDTSSVKVAGSDYVVKDLEDAVIDPVIIKKTVDDMFLRGGERKKWLVFCVTIKHAYAVLEEIDRISGLNAQIVTSETPMAQRDKILKQYKLSHNHPDAVNCLVNVACLTTGFDAPETDLIALLRPTKSPVLYVQIAGRGMRIANGKKDCLWLDYTTTTSELGAVNKIKGRNKSTSNGLNEAPFRYCDECGNEVPLHLNECPECGYLMPVEIKDPHGTKAGSAQVIEKDGPEPEIWRNVVEIGYYKHMGRNGKPPTMRIDYFYNMFDDPISEWKCFEHDGFALKMGAQWWADHVPTESMPLTVDEAVAMMHDPSVAKKVPNRIKTQKDGKYQRVKGYQYGNDPQVPKVISKAPFQGDIDRDLPF